MATRMEQLINDIASMQQEVADQADLMDKKDTAIKPTLDKLLKHHGYASFSELETKVKAQLTPEQKKAFQDFEALTKATSKNYEIAFGCTLMIGGIASTLGAGMC